jgi:hypothetical protein
MSNNIQAIVDHCTPDLVAQLEKCSPKGKWVLITDRIAFYHDNDPYIIDTRCEGVYHPYLLEMWYVEDLTDLTWEDVKMQGGLPVVIDTAEGYVLTSFRLSKKEADQCQ